MKSHLVLIGCFLAATGGLLVYAHHCTDGLRSSIESSTMTPAPAAAPESRSLQRSTVCEGERVREAEAALADSSTPAPPPLPRATPEEHDWEEKWGALSLGELQSRHDEFALALVERANPEYQAHFELGDYDVVGVGTKYTVDPGWDPLPLCQIRVPGQGASDARICKVTLREAEYPELYALQRENLWVKRRIETLRSVAMLK